MHNWPVNKNALIVKEGQLNELVYIVFKGEFIVRKKIHADIPVANDSVKQFLQGVTAKRSIRGVFNQKINNLTHARGLTNSTEVLKDEDIFTLGEGQIFGEERFIEILERREHDKRNSKQSAVGNNDNYRNTIAAPFTIKCLSSVGELYKITSD